MTSPPPSELNVGDIIQFHEDAWTAADYYANFFPGTKWIVTNKGKDKNGNDTITFRHTRDTTEKTKIITNLEGLENYYTKINDSESGVQHAGGRKSRLTRNKRNKSKRTRKSRKIRSKKNKSKRNKNNKSRH